MAKRDIVVPVFSLAEAEALLAAVDASGAAAKSVTCGRARLLLATEIKKIRAYRDARERARKEGH